MIESKWLKFTDVSDPKKKTKTILVINKTKGEQLGVIKWDCGWRQYIFDDGSVKFAVSCLDDLSAYIKELRHKDQKSLAGFVKDDTALIKESG